MGQKSWNLKLYLEDDDRQLVDQTIERWNAGVRDICLVLLRMRRGDWGESGRALWDYLAQARTRYHVLYYLTDPPKPRPASKAGAEEWDIAQPFLEVHGKVDTLVKARFETLGCFWGWAIRAARERITSYHEHVAAWETEHKAWLEEKAEWETEHPQYMRLRPLIEQFHEESGVTRGRWGRWGKWLEFLERPEVVDWEQTGATLDPLTDDDREWAKKNRKNAVARERKRLFEKNPQLQRFHDLHRTYERRFARTGRRRNPDGFRHPPTFTLPSLPNRPDWPRLQRNEGWRNLDLERQTIDLLLPGRDGRRGVWSTFRFVPDPRMRRLTRLVEPFKPKTREIYEYSWHNQLGERTYAQPAGIKLIQREGGIFASISFNLYPVESPIPVAQKHAGKYSPRWVREKIREEAPDLPLTTCAIDLAVSHLGAATVAREGEVFARRLLNHRFHTPAGDRDHAINIPTMQQLNQARRALSRARAKTGGVRRGDDAFVRHRQRYRHLKDDRIKKAVAAMFQYARHYDARILLFEDLQALRPDAALDRGLNSAMQRWNRGMIVQFAKQVAEDFGLRVLTVGAGYTSRLCARCDSLGVRFDQGRRARRFEDNSASEPAARTELRAAKLGDWFYCPDCRRRVHADLNASENLHRVFLGTFPKAKGLSTRDGVHVDGRQIKYADVERAAADALGLDAVV